MIDEFFYIKIAPTIIIAINAFFLSGYVLFIFVEHLLTKKPFNKNQIMLVVLFGYAILFIITSLQADVDWIGTNQPKLGEQIIMFGRVVLCSLVAYCACILLNRDIQNKSFFKNLTIWLIPVSIFVIICMLVGTQIENNIQPILCCGDGSYSVWGHPYRWALASGDKFPSFYSIWQQLPSFRWIVVYRASYFHGLNNIRFYPMEFLTNIIFWFNLGIILFFIIKQSVQSKLKTRFT